MLCLRRKLVIFELSPHFSFKFCLKSLLIALNTVDNIAYSEGASDFDNLQNSGSSGIPVTGLIEIVECAALIVQFHLNHFGDVEGFDHLTSDFIGCVNKDIINKSTSQNAKHALMQIHKRQVHTFYAIYNGVTVNANDEIIASLYEKQQSLDVSNIVTISYATK